MQMTGNTVARATLQMVPWLPGLSKPIPQLHPVHIGDGVATIG